MDVAIVEPKNRGDWDRFVRDSPRVIAWHSYEYSDLLGRYYGTRFYPFAVYDGPNVIGILPLYRIKTLRAGDALMSVPHFVAGGIIAEQAAVQRALLDKAIALGTSLGISRLTLKQYKYKVDGPLSTDESYYNRELTVSPDIDQIRASITDANRAKIDESARVDTTLDYPSQDVETFYRFLLRDQHAAGVPCVSGAWVRALFATGSYQIALLRHNGELVAATMAKKFKHTVSFPFSCLRDQREQTQLFAYSLYWKLITQLAGEGITIVHSGRIPKTDAAVGYRLGWGGTKCSYYYQYHGVAAGKTEFSTKRGSKRQLVESVWKKMPTSVARVLGPLVVKQFP
ncbi:MAG TPA: hypothetical protein VI485_28375 [Vicinamibacterales bacterium]|nr:hypothetical protein [Vicinamibacterales bacterium]